MSSKVFRAASRSTSAAGMNCVCCITSALLNQIDAQREQGTSSPTDGMLGQCYRLQPHPFDTLREQRLFQMIASASLSPPVIAEAPGLLQQGLVVEPQQLQVVEHELVGVVHMSDEAKGVERHPLQLVQLILQAGICLQGNT